MEPAPLSSEAKGKSAAFACSRRGDIPESRLSFRHAQSPIFPQGAPEYADARPPDGVFFLLLLTGVAWGGDSRLLEARQRGALVLELLP